MGNKGVPKVYNPMWGWEACLPTPLPASLAPHKNMYQIPLYVFLTLLEPSMALVQCSVYSVSLLRSQRQLQDRHGLHEPWSSNSDREGDNGSCAAPSISADDAKKSLSACHTVFTQQCPGRNLTLAKQNDKHGEFKTTVN